MQARFLFTIMAALVCAASAAAAAAPEPADSAEMLVEKMLAALGGRDRWAQLTGTINDSQQNRAAEPTVVRAVIAMDFREPRFRIDTYAPGFATTRVINGEASWRRTREGVVENLPAEVYRDDMRWYGAHLYRTIHRMAAKDPAFAYRLAGDGRLEIVEGGKRLLWFRLDAKGEPFAFGARDDDAGSLCGPWEFDAVGVKHPIWVSNADGSWRANAKSVTLNPVISDETLARSSPQSR